MTAVLTELFGGLGQAGVYFLVALGLTLTFGTARLINVAHGSFYMYGAFATATVVGALTAKTMAFWVAIAIVPILVGILGGLLEMTVVRWLYNKEHLTQLLATLGASYVLADVALWIWGTNGRSVAPPSALSGHVLIAGAPVPTYNIFLIGIGGAVGIVLWYFLARTKTGWKVRGAVQDPVLLASLGVNVRRLNLGVFAAGAYLGGLAGVVVAPLISVSPGIDIAILVDAFIITIIGGLGSVGGAAVGAIIIGLFETASTLWAPALSSIVVYIAMIVTLLIRPSGLFGAKAR